MSPIKNGQRVSYTGSIAECHGPATVIMSTHFGDANASMDGYRYSLMTDTGQTLLSVRRQSFALVSLPS